MVTIRDVIQIKKLEAKLGRKLLAEESDGSVFFAKDNQGYYQRYQVNLVRFPYDLLPDYAPSMNLETDQEIEACGFRIFTPNDEGVDEYDYDPQEDV